MTEREKIIKVIDEWAKKAVKTNKFDGASVYNPHNAAGLADALITAGYGNVEEVEHRAVVTERALLVACDDIKGLCRYLYEIEKITKAITIKCYHPEKIVPREYIVIAEKELTEEGKDD